MIKNKLIKARKDKEYTQESMAKILHMTQSQYHRREKGEIKISNEEWERIAEALNTSVEDIKEDDAANIHQVNNYDNISGNYSASNNYFYNIPEFLFQNQQEYINLLKKEIQELTKRIKILEKQ
ncbi:helix-turn-helix domain-containing protein [Chryseobacterium sp. X308]|uniref:helix-turn-helix transcriptional regulator n=1 Tax=Chryseobacterium sp. X308 TaxID=2884873 RepID=UPI001D14E091|nr:helix-turn-helix transcriptional regulator [Chryseobacterium sp. X308]MCC3213657.1 helix-turn-helix domain-containing protein [Chryseobacterium sp. X308]